MKKRTQLLVLSVLIFLVLVVVLSSSIFSFSQVGIDYLSTTIKLEVTNNSLLDDSCLTLGKSIFFVDKETASQNIEKQNPYIKVVNIETVFPNKLIFHVAERQELYAIKHQNEYFILDEEGKILSKENSVLNSAGAPIIVNGFFDEECEFQEGTYIENNDALENLTYFFKEWQTKLSVLKVHIKSVEKNGNTLNILMRCGLNIAVFDSNLDTSNKLNLAFSIYDNAENIEDKTRLEIHNVKNESDAYELKGFLS